MERVLVVGPIQVPSLSGVQLDHYERPLQGISQLDADFYTTVVMSLPMDRIASNGSPIDRALDFIHAVQEKAPGTPIIVVARRNSLELERSIRERGVFCYLCQDLKPQNWREILTYSFAYSTAQHPRNHFLPLAS
ncbi:hypothetical protein IIA15_10135 [candidate division TA06 bacterium]|nr:hypothetical protein [candidate division TA06 bacterium]